MTEDGRKGSTFNIIPISFHLRSEATREANKQKKGIPASLRDKKKKKKKEEERKKGKRCTRERYTQAPRGARSSTEL